MTEKNVESKFEELENIIIANDYAREKMTDLKNEAISHITTLKHQLKKSKQDERIVSGELNKQMKRIESLEADNAEYISIIMDLLTSAPNVNKKQWSDIHARYMKVNLAEHKPRIKDIPKDIKDILDKDFDELIEPGKPLIEMKTTSKNLKLKINKSKLEPSTGNDVIYGDDL